MLIISSGNSGKLPSFVEEQGQSLELKGIEIKNFLIMGKGYFGYLSNLSKIQKEISTFKPYLLHAHYGLSALLANFQRKVPVISTFHGSDILTNLKNRILSQVASILSAHSIAVNHKMCEFLLFPHKLSVIPCGVNLDTFFPMNKEKALGLINLSKEKVRLLFPSNFEYFEKNYPLAKNVMDKLGDKYDLIELKGYNRAEVNLLFNACDVALMTSISEGSPQFIKEAMACNCPIVTTNVGDVKAIIGETAGCFVTSFDPGEIVEKIKSAVDYRRKYGQTAGRERIIKLKMDSESIAERIMDVYYQVLNK